MKRWDGHHNMITLGMNKINAWLIIHETTMSIGLIPCKICRSPHQRCLMGTNTLLALLPIGQMRASCVALLGTRKNACWTLMMQQSLGHPWGRLDRQYLRV
jgi:hypothetical protein